MSEVKDITGYRSGRLLVLGMCNDPSAYREKVWTCICDCGNTVVRRGSELRNGTAKSCGCLKHGADGVKVLQVNGSAGTIDERGNVYSRLTVVSLNRTDERGRGIWNCRCECGNTTVVHGAQLRGGHTHSCGCLRHERAMVANTRHGMADTELYWVWRSMRQRCTNPQSQGYKHYGERGITYHPDFETFEGFYAVMGDSYHEGLELERIDNDGNYEPGNLRWATHEEQMNNTRRTREFIINGEKRRSMTRIAREHGLTRRALEGRLARGSEINDALSRKMGERPKREYDYDLVIGLRFGDLVVEEYSRSDSNHQKYFICRCDCGNTKEVRLSSLKYGSTTSCGCAQKRAVRKATQGVSTAMRNMSLDLICEIKNATHSMSVEDIAEWYQIPEHTIRGIIDGRLYRDVDY